MCSADSRYNSLPLSFVFSSFTFCSSCCPLGIRFETLPTNNPPSAVELVEVQVFRVAAASPPGARKPLRLWLSVSVCQVSITRRVFRKALTSSNGFYGLPACVSSRNQIPRPATAAATAQQRARKVCKREEEIANSQNKTRILRPLSAQRSCLCRLFCERIAH